MNAKPCIRSCDHQLLKSLSEHHRKHTAMFPYLLFSTIPTRTSPSLQLFNSSISRKRHILSCHKTSYLKPLHATSGKKKSQDPALECLKCHKHCSSSESKSTVISITQYTKLPKETVTGVVCLTRQRIQAQLFLCNKLKLNITQPSQRDKIIICSDSLQHCIDANTKDTDNTMFH